MQPVQIVIDPVVLWIVGLAGALVSLLAGALLAMVIKRLDNVEAALKQYLERNAVTGSRVDELARRQDRVEDLVFSDALAR